MKMIVTVYLIKYTKETYLKEVVDIILFLQV